VLVVDDVETTRHHIVNVLHRDGYDVVEAIDGLEALNKVASRHFDAILLDLVMPNVDGWQFRQTQLRHPELAGIPTVVVTIRPLREPDRYVLRPEDVILKPFEDDALLEVVAKACRRANPPLPAVHAYVNQLFWSRRGEIACWHHAPRQDWVRWHDERWAAIPEGAARHRIIYQCQHCPGQNGPVGHRTRSDGEEGQETH
jgi:two-component system response regulator MprA